MKNEEIPWMFPKDLEEEGKRVNVDG